MPPGLLGFLQSDTLAVKSALIMGSIQSIQALNLKQSQHTGAGRAEQEVMAAFSRSPVGVSGASLPPNAWLVPDLPSGVLALLTICPPGAGPCHTCSWRQSPGGCRDRGHVGGLCPRGRGETANCTRVMFYIHYVACVGHCISPVQPAPEGPCASGWPVSTSSQHPVVVSTALSLAVSTQGRDAPNLGHITCTHPGPRSASMETPGKRGHWAPRAWRQASQETILSWVLDAGAPVPVPSSLPSSDQPHGGSRHRRPWRDPRKCFSESRPASLRAGPKACGTSWWPSVKAHCEPASVVSLDSPACRRHPPAVCRRPSAARVCLVPGIWCIWPHAPRPQVSRPENEASESSRETRQARGNEERSRRVLPEPHLPQSSLDASGNVTPTPWMCRPHLIFCRFQFSVSGMAGCECHGVAPLRRLPGAGGLDSEPTPGPPAMRFLPGVPSHRSDWQHPWGHPVAARLPPELPGVPRGQPQARVSRGGPRWSLGRHLQ